MGNIFENLQKLVASVVITITSITGVTAPASVENQVIPTVEPTQTIQGYIVTRSGEVSYGGQSVKYTLNIPKNGGEISGSVSGICEGQISGTFDGGEGGNIKGFTNPSCGIAFLRQTFNLTYFGKLYLEQGKADVSWEGNIPSTPGKGSYTFNFEPER